MTRTRLGPHHPGPRPSASSADSVAGPRTLPAETSQVTVPGPTPTETNRQAGESGLGLCSQAHTRLRPRPCPRETFQRVAFLSKNMASLIFPPMPKERHTEKCSKVNVQRKEKFWLVVGVLFVCLF